MFRPCFSGTEQDECPPKADAKRGVFEEWQILELGKERVAATSSWRLVGSFGPG